MMSAEFYSNCSSKKRPEHCSSRFVIIVAYQNAKVLFTPNVMEKGSKLTLAYLSFRKITWKREDR